MFQEDTVTVCNTESRPSSSSSSSSCNLKFSTKTTHCLADGMLALVGTGARHGAVLGQMVTILNLDVKGRRKAEILGHSVLWWLQCFLSVRVSHSPSGQRLRLPWFNTLKDPDKASWRGMRTHTHTQTKRSGMSRLAQSPTQQGEIRASVWLFSSRVVWPESRLSYIIADAFHIGSL